MIFYLVNVQLSILDSIKFANIYSYTNSCRHSQRNAYLKHVACCVRELLNYTEKLSERCLIEGTWVKTIYQKPKDN